MRTFAARDSGENARHLISRVLVLVLPSDGVLIEYPELQKKEQFSDGDEEKNKTSAQLY